MEEVNVSYFTRKPMMERGMTFKEYYQYTQLLAEGKHDHHTYSEEQLSFVKLNFFRMKRILKNICIPVKDSEAVKRIEADSYWVVLAEPWCADAANVLPIIAMLSSLNMKIDLRVFLRDENPELMDQYLTNGTRSIPKLICYDQELEEIGVWGPRPKELRDYIEEVKLTAKPPKDELKRLIQIWYNIDGGHSVLKEFSATLPKWYRKLDRA